MHSQAIHKPLGYARDFRFMELAYTDRLEGDSLFSRFMHYFSKRHAVTLSVQHRELRLREAIAKAIHAPGDGPVRILSLACGAAVEVQRFLSGIDDLPRPVELYLIDQDREALSHCHRELFRILTERHQSRLPVKVRVLHVAVQQLLHPRGIDEHAVLSELRHNVDLIYSAGLLDYLGRRVATRLVRRLYGMLRPGGRCLVGNMKIVPENHWLMEFILDWVLIYRTPESMRALAAQLRPTPDEISIVEDETGYCMFLDVARPTS
jgi:chemotaxis methyl-accepting protein methylase